MKLDAKTIIALTGLVSVLLGGTEMRIKVGEIDTRLQRVERAVDQPVGRFAANTSTRDN